MMDLTSYIGAIAQKLLGQPNRQLSSSTQLRFGTNGAIAVEIAGQKRGQWYDHENQRGGGAWELLRLVGGFDDSDIPDWAERHLGVRSGDRLYIVATYDYADESGNLLFQVCRCLPKTFRQRRPNGKGGWEWKGGERQVPYQLPKLVAAAANRNGRAARVYIAEGEKDCDRLAAWGLTATCNPAGAGKWRAEFAKYFAGFDVVILADNDAAGKKHAQGVAANLAPVAASVRIPKLEGLPDKADISDWIAAGGTQSDLEALIELTPPWEQPELPARIDKNGISLSDFYSYMPLHNYIYTPSLEMWPAGSINSRIPPIPVGPPDENDERETIKASSWLDQNHPVEQMTWAPGMPMLIKDRLVADGGWIEHNGVTCFNLYRPPTIKPGDPAQAGKWFDHVYKVFPDDAGYIIYWLAHRVQRPQEKINHALVLGGLQGIGKDTILEPVKRAIAPWNFSEPSPLQVLGRFNGFAKSVITRISEARDLGDADRYQFYERLKIYCAAPPDTIRVDEKNLREHSVFNCCGVIITTNYKTNGIYLPADDRRHYVAWSSLSKEEFDKEYWEAMWDWYDDGGDRHVASYLASLDISAFKAKAPPPKTPAFWEIVDAHRSSEDAEIADTIDKLGNPEAFTIGNLIYAAVTTDLADWLKDRKNRRIIPHRLETCGYVPVRNDGAKDGMWKILGRRQAIYGKTSLTKRDQLKAAETLAKR